MTNELDAIAARYARRAGRGEADRYSLLRPEVWQIWQERERALLHLLARRPGRPADWRATEVGCGAGGNLLDLLRLGLAPDHLSGIELLPERLALARAALPERVTLLGGDASQAPIAPASQDLVLQSTVFSSILDDELQQRVAAAMWAWLKPGGAVLWYDFVVNNPRNPDVRGVPLARVRALFPQGRLQARRVTLAPPLARMVCHVHPALYTLFNALPLLRTHRLVLITKLDAR
ncbi:MAG: SAM-dependent methyltransferase [Roseateles depolymerans]|uniref:SAM-dependent methyltransferase n=1 Tax=Roseateles depolymerans TaxID=76731 RepID=A0A2W5F473_9BURK|nr:MAG: SAM-dependent methyltransferase [Roseateles depolymerans]